MLMKGETVKFVQMSGKKIQVSYKNRLGKISCDCLDLNEISDKQKLFNPDVSRSIATLGSVPASGALDPGFMLGEKNMALPFGIQKLTGIKGLGPDVQSGFDLRLGKEIRWHFDYFNIRYQIPLTAISPLNINPSEVGYITDGINLMGYQSYKTPGVTELLALSTSQFAINVNLVRTPKKCVPVFISLDWSTSAYHTPIYLNGITDLVSDKVNLANGKIDSLANAVNTASDVDSIRRTIQQLTQITGSLTQIPTTQNIYNLEVLNPVVTNALSSSSGPDNTERENTGNRKYLFYTGPSLVLGTQFLHAKNLSFQVYGKYLFSISNNYKVSDQLYLTNSISALDSVSRYRELLNELGIPIKETIKKEELINTDNKSNFGRSLLLVGAQAGYNLYAVNVFANAQAVWNVKDGVKNTINDLPSIFTVAVGVNIDLLMVLKKPNCLAKQ